MLKMSSQVENIVNAYKTLAKIPSIVGGKLNLTGNKVSAKWSVRALDKGKSVKYTSSYLLDNELKVIDQSDFGSDVSNELLSAVSPRETYKAVIREEKNGSDKKQYLEVWNRHTLQHCIDLTALDLHGDVYADSEFGGLEWSPDEGALVYVAERKPPKAEPYVKRKPEDKADAAQGDTPPNKGEEFVYRQDWGEQLEGKVSSVVVVCRLPAETVTVLDHLPAGDCPGQVRFQSDGSSVVGVAWRSEPRRLGLIFCTNRPSYIFSLTLEGEMCKVSGEGVAVRSARCGPRGRLCWLQRAADGPHHAAHQLATTTNSFQEVTVLIDIVQKERTIDNAKSENVDNLFYGLFCQALPARCFTTDGRIVFSTPSATHLNSYVYDTDGDRLLDISYRPKSFSSGSTTVLDVSNDVILASYSEMNRTPQLIVARLPAKGSESSIEWVQVSKPVDLPASISKAGYNLLRLTHKNSADDVKDFTAIYLSPKNEEGRKFPLIVWPHGGPHSCFVNAYSLEAALFVMLGFAVLQVNYRGSSGAGEQSLRALPGHCGEIDVADCKLATDRILNQQPVDAKNVMLVGGSHGGFLVAHLSGQHPDTYAAVVSRNPVVDLASMHSCTDITDWCCVEAGFPWSEVGAASEAQLVAMRRCSPLAHVHRVVAPTALMLGAKDKRVPHYQGLEWARRLAANRVDTRVYMYDDNHSLSSVPAEMDSLINSARWFLQHLKE